MTAIGVPPGTAYAPPSDLPTAPRAPAVPTSRRHLPALDGIRGLAALAVMCFHFGRAEVTGSGAAAIAAVSQFGWAGVDLFFVLSGFLITGILLDTRDEPRFFRTFYARRSLRIFPLYFFFVAAYVFVIAPRLAGAPSDLSPRQAWLWTYLSNFDVARHGWYRGGGSHANNLWSLAIEEQFYLVFPLIVFLVRRRLALVAAAFVVASLLARGALMHWGFPPRTGYVVTIARLDGLGLGALLAMLYRTPTGFTRIARWAPVAVGLGVLAAVAVTVRIGQFSMNDWRSIVVGVPAMSLASAGVLVLALAPNGWAFATRLFESTTLRFLGLYSYGLYMWHPLVGGMLRRAGVSQDRVLPLVHSSAVAVLVVLAVKIAAAIAVALVSYACVERPFLRLKDRVAQVRARAVVPATT
jgi:peptidoglycan/LPS O-acetylase OafA/YrhL